MGNKIVKLAVDLELFEKGTQFIDNDRYYSLHSLMPNIRRIDINHNDLKIFEEKGLITIEEEKEFTESDAINMLKLFNSGCAGLEYIDIIDEYRKAKANGK